MTSELAVIDGGHGKVPARREMDVLAIAESADIVQELGAKLIASRLLPDSIKTPEAAMLIMLQGREIGMGPVESLSKIDVIQGKPTLSAEGMRSLVLRAGHKLRLIEKTEERCTVEGVRLDDPAHKQRVAFSMDDARRAGLLGKKNWKERPRAMLAARATSELCRDMFPDVIAGASYVPEELGATGEAHEEGEVLAAPDRESRAPRDEPQAVEAAEVVEEDDLHPEHQEKLDQIADVLVQLPASDRPPEERLWVYAESKYGNACNALKQLEDILAKPSREATVDDPNGQDLDDEPVPDFAEMQGAARDAAKPVQPARKSQVDLLRTLADEVYGGEDRLQAEIGASLEELTTTEADEWINRLTALENQS